jgi:hypothetical protein
MDVALILDNQRPKAQYHGSLTENTQETYEALHWHDVREKPSWTALEAAWNTYLANKQGIELAEQNRITAKETAISANLPTWTQVSTAVDAITNLAEAKVFIKKLSRVVYWLAKNSET